MMPSYINPIKVFLMTLLVMFNFNLCVITTSFLNSFKLGIFDLLLRNYIQLLINLEAAITS